MNHEVYHVLNRIQLNVSGQLAEYSVMIGYGQSFVINPTKNSDVAFCYFTIPNLLNSSYRTYRLRTNITLENTRQAN